MVVYSVNWSRDNELAKGSTKGRPKNDQYSFTFTVLCNKSSEASACLEHLFELHFGSNCGFTIEDGTVRMSRMKLDSRSFFFSYVFIDKMKRPLSIYDLSSGFLDVPRTYYWRDPVFKKS